MFSLVNLSTTNSPKRISSFLSSLLEDSISIFSHNRLMKSYLWRINREKLNNDLADTVNKEILNLVDNGCVHIQIDEPLFARQVKDALSFGIEGVERCFHKVPKNINKIIHICCGYTDHLDDEHYKKADPQSYFELSSDLNSMNIDQISIEDAHFKNDLTLFNKFPDKKIIFGAINGN